MSSAKEKAEELILKFMRLQEPNYNWFHSKLAKQCALIAVAEILSETEERDGMRVINNPYWMEVRNEIEKL
jgi:hypothetical protein